MSRSERRSIQMEQDSAVLLHAGALAVVAVGLALCVSCAGLGPARPRPDAGASGPASAGEAERPAPGRPQPVEEPEPGPDEAAVALTPETPPKEAPEESVSPAPAAPSTPRDRPAPGGTVLIAPTIPGESKAGAAEEADAPPSGSRRHSGGGGGAPAAPPARPATARVRMAPQGSEVRVGTRVSIVVAMTDATDVGSVPFHVVYNPAVLRFETGREGSFLMRGGRQTAFFAAPMSSGSEAVVGLSRLGRGDGIDGGGDLCTLTFQVVGPGNAGLGFVRAHVRDSRNRIVPAVFEPAAVIAY